MQQNLRMESLPFLHLQTDMAAQREMWPGVRKGPQPAELRGAMPPAKAVSLHDDRPAAWVGEVGRMHGVNYIPVQKVSMYNMKCHGAPKGNTVRKFK